MPQRAISVILACALACTMTPATPLAFADTVDDDSAQNVEQAAAEQSASSQDEILADDADNASADHVSEDVPVVATPESSASTQVAAGGASDADASVSSDADPSADIDMLTARVDLASTGAVLTSNGLVYQVNPDGETVALIGWAGTAPEGALAIPSQVVAGADSYKVTAANNVPGGGSLI